MESQFDYEAMYQFWRYKFDRVIEQRMFEAIYKLANATRVQEISNYIFDMWFKDDTDEGRVFLMNKVNILLFENVRNRCIRQDHANVYHLCHTVEWLQKNSITRVVGLMLAFCEDRGATLRQIRNECSRGRTIKFNSNGLEDRVAECLDELLKYNYCCKRGDKYFSSQFHSEGCEYKSKMTTPEKSYKFARIGPYICQKDAIQLMNNPRLEKPSVVRKLNFEPGKPRQLVVHLPNSIIVINI